MTRILRQNALQIVGVTVGVAMTAGLYGWTRHGSEPASGGPGPTAHATASARPTPTPDPREAAVIAAAKHYVEAVNRAYMTGKPDELNSLIVPESRAEGQDLAGGPVMFVTHEHKTFVVTATTYESVTASLLTNSAVVDLKYLLTGYDATWPGLQRTGASRTLPEQAIRLSYEFINGAWLLDGLT